MSETYSPQAAAEQARDSFRKAAKEFESFKLDTTVPESVRALAEKTVNQSREAYERGKDALEEAIDALERSFDAAGQGATAFNRKLIDLAQRKTDMHQNVIAGHGFRNEVEEHVAGDTAEIDFGDAVPSARDDRDDPQAQAERAAAGAGDPALAQ